MSELHQKQAFGDLKLTEPISANRHPAAVYLSGLSTGSNPTMRHALDAIASLLTNGECTALTLDWSKLRYHHTAAVRSVLLKKYAPRTASKMLCALRRVLKEAQRLGLIEVEDYILAVDLPRIDTPPQPLRGRALKESEIAALMDACQPEVQRKIDIRDMALIAILRCGLRRNEVVNLELKDFDPSTGAIEIHKGKRGAYRVVYAPDVAIELVSDWIEIRGRSPGALLCPIRKGGLIELRHMSADAVLKIVKRRGTQAGVKSFTPHDFRRTFCSDLLDAQVDIVTVASLAGHSKTEVTAKYDRRGEETKRQAMQKLSVPRPKKRYME